MNEIINTRIKNLRKLMKAEGVSAYVVYTSDEHQSEYIGEHFAFRKYLSGFTGSAGTLLVTETMSGLWTDGRYFLQAENELKDTEISLYRMGEKGVTSLSEYIEKLAGETDDFVLGTDLRLMSIANYKLYSKMSEKTGLVIKDVDFAKEVWIDRPKEARNEVRFIDEDISGRSIQDKLNEIREALNKNNKDSILIGDLSDVMWTFNLRGSDIQYNPFAVSFALITQKESYIFITIDKLTETASSALTNSGVTIVDYDDFDRCISNIYLGSVVCSYSDINAHVYNLIKDNIIINEPTYMYIRKHIKNEVEIALTKKWHIKDGLALTKFIYRIKSLVKNGNVINEVQAGQLLDELRFKTEGNLGLSFDTICAYGSNGAIVHYSAKENNCVNLRPDSFLLVDSGGQYEGATTDVTRTIALGKVSEKMKLHYTSVLMGMLDLADAVFLDGTRGENIDILARRPIWELGIDYRHGTGHGVGACLGVHEGPQAFRYRINDKNPQPKLEAGMITSDEPGIYLEGKYGIRIENLVLCVDKYANEWGKFLGFDTLTLVPYEKDAIKVEMLSKRQKDIINEYNERIYEAYKNQLDDEERSWLRTVTERI